MKTNTPTNANLIAATKNLNTVLEMNMPAKGKNTVLTGGLNNAAVMLEIADMENVTPETATTLRAIGTVLPGDPEPTSSDEIEVVVPKTTPRAKSTVTSVRTKVGVIATIIKSVTGKKPVTKQTILKRLIKKFPGRSEVAMMRTINTQIPCRINRERDFNVQCDDKGYWSVSPVSA